LKRVTEVAEKDTLKALNHKNKAAGGAIKLVRDKALATLSRSFPTPRRTSPATRRVEYRTMRSQVLETGEESTGGSRAVSPITIETVSCAGARSTLFTGGRPSLVAVTLGTSDDEHGSTRSTCRRSDEIVLLHYNFPPYSTAKSVRPGTSRGRSAMVPWPTSAPAGFRLRRVSLHAAVVSEILESNGSSSMATVCGGSLALMDAGVPMKAACAGVAMGLIKEVTRSPS